MFHGVPLGPDGSVWDTGPSLLLHVTVSICSSALDAGLSTPALTLSFSCPTLSKQGEWTLLHWEGENAWGQLHHAAGEPGQKALCLCKMSQPHRKERKQSLASVERLNLEISQYGKGFVICRRLLFGGGKRMANM